MRLRLFHRLIVIESWYFSYQAAVQTLANLYLKSHRLTILTLPARRQKALQIAHRNVDWPY